MVRPDSHIAAALRGRASQSMYAYSSLSALAMACAGTRALSSVLELDAPEDLEIVMSGTSGEPQHPVVRLADSSILHPTRHCWSQICSWVRAPLRFLDSLSPHAAAVALRDRWQTMGREEWSPRQLLIQAGGPAEAPLALRAMLGTTYARIWDAEVVEALDQRDWHAEPLAATHAKRTRPIATLWRDDNRLTLFLSGRRPVPGSDDLGGLRPGLLIENSEVGDSSLRVTTCLYTGLCSNLSIMGLEKEQTVAYRHVGAQGQVRLRQALQRAIAEATREIPLPLYQRLAKVPLPSGYPFADKPPDLAELARVEALLAAAGSLQSGADAPRQVEIVYTLEPLLGPSLALRAAPALADPWNLGPGVAWGSIWHVAQAVSSLHAEHGQGQREIAEAAGKVVRWGASVQNVG